MGSAVSRLTHLHVSYFDWFIRRSEKFSCARESGLAFAPLSASFGRSIPWPCSCGRAGTTTACPTTTPTRRWVWTADLWTSCGCLTLSSSTPNLLGSTMSQWKTSWSACSPTESFYTAAGRSKPDYCQRQTVLLAQTRLISTVCFWLLSRWPSYSLNFSRSWSYLLFVEP